MTIIKPKIPSSKSYTQRALILSALTEGKSRILSPLECDDSYHLRNALRELSATIDDTDSNCWIVHGLDRNAIIDLDKNDSPTDLSISSDAVHCWSENAGTVLRFISSLALILKRPIIIDGNRRLRKRPLHRLINTLESANISSKFIASKNSLPLLLHRDMLVKEKKKRRGKKKKKSKTADLKSSVSNFAATGEIWVDPSMTSQLLSGLLMTCPLLKKTVILKLSKETVSGPYVDMTLKAMKDFGYNKVNYIDDLTITVESGNYRRTEFTVEKDWSSAATMLTAAWLTCKAIDAEGLNPDSLQGDKAIVFFLETLSSDALEHHFDITDCPDIIGPLTIAALFSKGHTTISGINHTKIKECDRPATLCRELTKVGAVISEVDNALDIMPLSQDNLLKAMGKRELILTDHLSLDPEDDHRMAMAFGLLSLKIPYLEIKTRECVSKSFSGFWENLELFR